jgi:hypothetical protein
MNTQQGPGSQHIARDGELEFATLFRAQSGMESGDITFGVRVHSVSELPDGEKDELIKAAGRMTDSIKSHCGRNQIASDSPSRYCIDWEGDFWRLEIEGEFYDCFTSIGEAAVAIEHHAASNK